MSNQTQRRPAKPAEQDKAGKFARRIVTLGALVAGIACFAFNYGNVFELGKHLNVHPLIAATLPPAVDATLVAGLVGERYLSNHGVDGRTLRPIRWMTLISGVMVLGLNIALAAVNRNWGAVAYDAVPSLLLIGWAALYPWFLRQSDTVDRNSREQAATTAAAAAGPAESPPPPADNRRSNPPPQRRNPPPRTAAGSGSSAPLIAATVADLAAAGEISLDTRRKTIVEKVRGSANGELAGVTDRTVEANALAALRDLTTPEPESPAAAEDNDREPVGAGVTQ